MLNQVTFEGREYALMGMTEGAAMRLSRGEFLYAQSASHQWDDHTKPKFTEGDVLMVIRRVFDVENAYIEALNMVTNGMVTLFVRITNPSTAPSNPDFVGDMLLMVLPMTGELENYVGNIPAIIQQLRLCEFEDADGHALTNNVAFQALCRMSNKQVAQLHAELYPIQNYMGEGSRYGTHTVAIDLQSEEYRATVHWMVGGNCVGGEVLNEIPESINDRYNQFSDKDIEEGRVILVSEDMQGELGELHGFVLTHPVSGDTLMVEFDLSELIVGMRIVAWEKKER